MARRARMRRRPSRRRQAEGESGSPSGPRGGEARGGNVATIRAPEAPIGWPRAIAPPFTFTLSQSNPSSRPSASVCAAKASLISTRSKSPIAMSSFCNSRFTPCTGARNSHFGATSAWAYPIRPGERLERSCSTARSLAAGRRAVRDAGGVAGRHGARGRVPAILAARQVEDGLQLREGLHRRVTPGPVRRHDRVPAAALDRHGRHLVVEAARLLRSNGPLMTLERERVLSRG